MAAVEDDVHGPFGWRGGGGDGEVGFWGDFLGVEGLVFVLPGGAAHCLGVWGGRGEGRKVVVVVMEVEVVVVVVVDVRFALR